MNNSTVSPHDHVFRESPVAILCEDWAEICAIVMRDCEGQEALLDQRLARDPDYLRALRARHRIVDANPAALRLLGVADLAELQAKVSHLLPADPRGGVVRALLRGENFSQGERDLVSAQGIRTPILWRTNLPERPEDLRRVYFFAVDISAQRRTQEALDMARATLNHAGRLSLVGELVASMTHEVSQPVSSMSLLASAARRWLDQTPPDVEKARDFIGRISKSANHAAQVIGRIREFSRAGSRHVGPVDPALLIAEGLALVEHEARRLGIVLEVDLAPGLPLVAADPIQVKQVLVNIAVNAFQALAADGADPQGQAVHVRATRQGDGVEIGIADSGPGMAQIDRAMEPFFSTRPEGLGLGLSICKRIVEEHGGQLRIANLAPGTLVSFTLMSFTPPALDPENR